MACEGFEVAHAMVETGNPNSISDAGVGALALHACVEGAWLNVKINSGELAEHPEVLKMLAEGEGLRLQSEAHKESILIMVNEQLES